MKNIDFESYFNLQNQHYEGSYLIKIIEDLLNNKFDKIKEDVKNTNILVSEQEIINFLDKKMDEENPELKNRLKQYSDKKVIKDNLSLNFGEDNIEYIQNSFEEFYDDIVASRYGFDSYTLEYFKKYVSILKNKIFELLNIIEKIGNNDIESINKTLKKLDICLIEDNKISREDIIRLVTPTIQSINKLNEKVNSANDLSTYLTFKISKYSLFRDGLSENEIYPNKSLQIKNMENDYIIGNVPLSSNQKKELKESRSKSLMKTARMLIKY